MSTPRPSLPTPQAPPPPVPAVAPPPPTPAPRQFPCASCGASLAFAPGTTALRCPYCGTDNAIAAEPPHDPHERDYLAELERLAQSADTIEALAVRCDGCGAQTELPPHRTAGHCPFCGRELVAQAVSQRHVKPQYLLPFHVTTAQASDAFRRWIASLWFAPSDLKRFADKAGLTGIYIPAWTYDAHATTHYTGQRGDDYWTTETYSTTVNGKSVTRTRQVKRTRWSPASGTVRNRFDDLLVMATRSLPEASLDHLRPWDLPALVPYKDEYLAGFLAESYQIDLPAGFDIAKAMMVPTIHATIRSDIGGDHQRISTTRSTYASITYKHLLLPAYLSSYRYRQRTFRFLINARTGEVAGERPYSAWKIAFLVLVLLIVIATIAGIVALRS